MPEGTEREAKERQGQNWPGKHLSPNFPMKIKVAPFVFTNHCLSIKISLVLYPGVSLSIMRLDSKIIRYNSAIVKNEFVFASLLLSTNNLS